MGAAGTTRGGRRAVRVRRWRRTGRTAWLAALVCLALAAADRPAAAQRERAPARWTLSESATLDLWYHALATIGYESVGPLPYHAPGYAAALRRIKAARGIAPTPLERDAAALRATFATDSAFEVLHFVPLYFASRDPATFIALIDAIAHGGTTGPLPPEQRAGAGALTVLLGGPTQRAALARLSTDLDTEWQAFYAGQLARTQAARAAGIAALQRRWDERVMPALGSTLDAAGLAGGTIYLVPALGAEGRVVADPGARGTVAVAWPLDDAASDVPLFAAVRELCFPVVRRLPIDAVAHGDRAAAEVESARAAVRCGAELLDATAPALAGAYRETFRRAAAAAGGARRDFDDSYPLASTTERALAAEVRRLLAAGARRHAAARRERTDLER